MSEFYSNGRMKGYLESKIDEAVQADMRETLSVPTSLKLLEIRALCRIADSLHQIKQNMK